MELLTKKQLRERGWTDTLMGRFLGAHDATRPHPAWPRKPQKLYRVDRVEQAESLPKCRSVLTEVLGRKEREALSARWQAGQILSAEEWMECSSAEGMLRFIGGCEWMAARRNRATMLLGCALMRGILCWHHEELLAEEIGVAERFAEGLASSEDLDDAYAEGIDKLVAEEQSDDDDEDDFGEPDRCCGPGGVLFLFFEKTNFFHPKCPVVDADLLSYGYPGCPTDLIREIYGNPFCPVAIDPAWLTWRDRAVTELATVIHHKRIFELMPVLAVLLEAAGCDNPAILSHCRQKEGHDFGCWVVDALLGK